MKKTKIKFEDIKAGDLIETVDNVHGVKWVLTGIVFEKFGLSGEQEWRTAQGGVVVDETDEGIYRIDVTPVAFEDVQKGDKLKVTTKTGNVTTIVEDVALAKVTESVSPYWVGKDGHVLVMKRVYDTEQTIEILERAGE